MDGNKIPNAKPYTLPSRSKSPSHDQNLLGEW